MGYFYDKECADATDTEAKDSLNYGVSASLTPHLHPSACDIFSLTGTQLQTFIIVVYPQYLNWSGRLCDWLHLCDFGMFDFRNQTKRQRTTLQETQYRLTHCSCIFLYYSPI